MAGSHPRLDHFWKGDLTLLKITITTIAITIISIRITITIITIMTITVIPRQNTKEEFQDLHFIFYERLCDDPVSQTFDNFMMGFLYLKG